MLQRTQGHPAARAWCGNVGRLRRFLQACRGSVPKVLSTLDAVIAERDALKAWPPADPLERARVRGRCVDPEELWDELRLGKFYNRSVDRLGHPVVVQRPNRVDARVSDTMKFRSLLYALDCLEQAIDEGFGNPDGRWTLILSQRPEPTTGRKEPSVSASLRHGVGAVRMMLRNYPERLYRIYVVNASGFTHLVWRTLCNVQLVDEVVRAKVCFAEVTSDPRVGGRRRCEILERNIVPWQLEEEFGGEDDFSWDPVVNFRLHEYGPARLAPPADPRAPDLSFDALTRHANPRQNLESCLDNKTLRGFWLRPIQSACRLLVSLCGCSKRSGRAGCEAPGKPQKECFTDDRSDPQLRRRSLLDAPDEQGNEPKRSCCSARWPRSCSW